MNRILPLLLIIALGPIIGGVYGILHDQLTYSISPEYYTKFKFYQFGLTDNEKEAILPNPRLVVSVVGFMATWWVGLPIGLFLGLVGRLAFKENKQMLTITLKAFAVTMLVAFVTGLIGLSYGTYLAETGVNWWMPDNLIDKRSFIMVGSMHNFSYIGGLIGLITGILYIKRKRKKLNP